MAHVRIHEIACIRGILGSKSPRRDKIRFCPGSDPTGTIGGRYSTGYSYLGILYWVSCRSWGLEMNQQIYLPSSGFKLDVSVRFFEKVRGKKLYKVRNLQSNHVIFVGTKEECRRYLKILQEKIDKQLNRKRLTRNKTRRTYRTHFSDFSKAPT